MKRVYISFGKGLVELTEYNESKIKAFLYSNYPPTHELKLVDENGKTDSKLKLEDLFNEPINKEDERENRTT